MGMPAGNKNERLDPGALVRRLLPHPDHLVGAAGG